MQSVPTIVPSPPDRAVAALAALHQQASEAAGLLRLLANRNRLLLLCHLAAEGEMAVGPLAGAVGLSQSALSQHLARLRRDGLVAPRKTAQTVRYRLADPRAARLLGVLHEMFCPQAGAATQERSLK